VGGGKTGVRKSSRERIVGEIGIQIHARLPSKLKLCKVNMPGTYEQGDALG
jgi:hypothetical protein